VPLMELSRDRGGGSAAGGLETHTRVSRTLNMVASCAAHRRGTPRKTGPVDTEHYSRMRAVTRHVAVLPVWTAGATGRNAVGRPWSRREWP
jgi:hypothetical protein